MKKIFWLSLILILIVASNALAEEWLCPSCENTASGNFCSNCGTAKPSENWTCPSCGNSTKGNFCSSCGAAKPSGYQNSDEAVYKNAHSLMSKGNYKEAIEKFESLGTYLDSTRLTMYCRALQAGENGQYDVAIEALRSLEDVQDSKMRIFYYQARAYEDAGWLDYALQEYKKNPLFLDSQQRIESINSIIAEAKQTKYDQAIAYTNAGEYWYSNALLKELGDYKDALLVIEYNKIRNSEDTIAENDYSGIQTLINEYNQLGEVLDALQRAQALSDKMDSELSGRYQAAQDLANKEEFSSAAAAFAAITGYKDSEKYATYCEARNLEAQASISDFELLKQAKTLYEGIKGFLDSTMRFTTIENIAAIRLATEIKPFTSELYLVEYKSKKGLIDRQGNIITPIQWDSIGSFNSGLAIVRKKSGYSSNYKYGCINEKGEIIIPVTWDDIGQFKNGVAVIEKGENYSDRKYGLIDNKGIVIVDPIYDYMILMDDGYAVVKVEGNYHSKYGIIDSTGRIIVEPQWDDIETWYYSYDGGEDDKNLFHDGLAAVKKDKKTGFVNTEGKLIIPVEWDSADKFSCGLSLVKSGSKYGYIDTVGNMVIKPEYENAYTFRDGAAIVKTGTYKNKDEKYGLIDKTGKVIVQIKYDEIKYAFTDAGIGYFVAEEKIGSGWNVSWRRSVFDANGRLVGGKSWDYVSVNSKDNLTVKTDDGDYKQLSIIDGTLSDRSSNGAFGMSSSVNVWYSYKDENGLYGYKDAEENIVIKAQWATVDWMFDGDVASVGDGNQYTTIRKYGAINRNGDLVVPCEYDESINFVDGQALVKKDGYWYSIDTTGKIIF